MAYCASHLAGRCERLPVLARNTVAEKSPVRINVNSAEKCRKTHSLQHPSKFYGHASGQMPAGGALQERKSPASARPLLPLGRHV
ncbi:hypothetical protein E2C01_086833 [Portunus trituberculatus]|uniref:Uncharacterized protein n=1 Tax=Portunus trituberculatus TaxID=210409 RepID=A0A5B7JAS6_PORTR|nr:hypothetical protein [Portunus trituberculatus]